MDTDTVSVNELALQTAEAMQRMGVAIHSSWDYYGHTLLPLIKLHTEHGKTEFDRDLVTNYVLEIEKRMEQGSMSLHYCGLRPQEARQLLRANIDFSTGEILITIRSDMTFLCFESKFFVAAVSGMMPPLRLVLDTRHGSFHPSLV
jgi:integrase